MMATSIPSDVKELHTKKYLVFEVSHRAYSLPISNVREIMEYVDIEPIPMALGFIAGAINLRGSVIPVVSLSVRLGQSQQAVTNRTCIIIVETIRNGEPVVLGLMVDMVNRVIDLALGEIDEVPSLGGQLENRFVRGLAKSGEFLLAILSVDELLTIREMDLLEEVIDGEHPDDD